MITLPTDQPKTPKDFLGREIILNPTLCDAPELALRLAQTISKAATVTIDCVIWRAIPTQMTCWYKLTGDENKTVPWMFDKANEILADNSLGEWLITNTSETFIPYLYFDGRTGRSPLLEAFSAVARFESEIFPRWKRELISLGAQQKELDKLSISHGILAGELQIGVVKMDNGEWVSRWGGNLYLDAKATKDLLGGTNGPWLDLNATAAKSVPHVITRAQAIKIATSEIPNREIEHYLIYERDITLLGRPSF